MDLYSVPFYCNRLYVLKNISYIEKSQLAINTCDDYFSKTII